MNAPTIRINRPEFSLLSIARAIWKHRLIALLIWAATSILGIAMVHRIPAIYKAEALILVDPQKVPEKFVTSTVTDDLQDRLATISQEILSTTRLQKIVDDLGLYPTERKTHIPEEIVEVMRRDIDVKVEKGRAFRITYQGRNPQTAAEVVNRITDLYIAQNLKSRETQAEGTTQFIENQLQDAKQRLDQLEAAVSQYKVRHTGELPEQETSLSAALVRLQLELQGNQDTTNRSQQEKLALESALSSAESAESALKQSLRPAAPAASPETDAGEVLPPTHVKSASEILADELAVLHQHYTDDHPDVIRLKLRIAAQRRLEDRESKQGNPVQRKSVAQARANADSPAYAELVRVRERISTLRAQIAALGTVIDRSTGERQRILDSTAVYQRRIEQLPFREQDMAALTRDYQITKENYRSLLDKKIAAEMASDLERRQKAEKFRILDKARAPGRPFKPNRPALYALCVMAGLIGGIALGVGKEFRSAVLLGEWELPKGTPVIGLIPYIESELKNIATPSIPRGQTVGSAAAMPLAVLAVAGIIQMISGLN